MTKLDIEFKNIIKEISNNGFRYDQKLANKLYIKYLTEYKDSKSNKIKNRLDLLLSLENFNIDDKIHSDYKLNGTITGRCTHTNPNIASIPKGDIRKCFTVKKGYKLIGIDLSNLELRLLAHFMKDEEYINEILTGDIHEKNRIARGLNTRDERKEFIYSFLYGAGDKLLSVKLNCDISEAKQIRKRFLDKTPKLKRLVELVELKNKITMLDKETKIIVDESYKRLNYLLQGNGSIIMKKFIVLLKDKLDESEMKFNIVANIHDEIQIEVENDYESVINDISKKTIKEVSEFYGLRCNLDIGIKEGENWYETH